MDAFHNSRVDGHSTVERTMLGGKNAYVKHYAVGAERDDQLVRARLLREADVIGRIEQSGLFHRRLGRLHLLEIDPEQARIVTEQAPGRPLDSWLRCDYRRVVGYDGLRALYLAGRWLRQFQAIATSNSDAVQLSAIEPYDLHEYCRLRVAHISELGFSWPDRDFQSKLDRRLTVLLAQVPAGDTRLVLGHGDFQPINMLWDGEKLTVIDFEMASLKVPLADVASFVHRLDLLPVYFPWKRWPVAAWRRAFLRGYGRDGVDASPAYVAQMIRMWLCRLHSFVARPTPTLKDRLHNGWIARCSWKRLNAAVSGD